MTITKNSIHETLLDLAKKWVEIENLLYEDSKRIAILLAEKEQLQLEIKRLENQASVQRSYIKTLKRQLDEASL
jgi:hypothetical protein